MILKPRLFRKPNLSHPLSKGLVGCWLMNEGSGSIVQDLSGNGNTGTFGAGAASPIWTSGNIGPCLSFDGGDGVNCGNNSTIQIDSAFTIVGWFKTSFAGLTIIGKALDAVVWWFIILNGTTGKLEGQFDDNNVKKLLSSTTTGLNDNKWHQFAVIRDSGGYYVYLDGKYENTIDNNGSISNSADLYIGKTQVDIGPNPWNGLLDNFSIYNQALLASEIQQLYREPFCMFERDPIELWSAATQGGGAAPSATGIMTTNTGYWGSI